MCTRCDIWDDFPGSDHAPVVANFAIAALVAPGKRPPPLPVSSRARWNLSGRALCLLFLQAFQLFALNAMPVCTCVMCVLCKVHVKRIFLVWAAELSVYQQNYLELGCSCLCHIKLAARFPAFITHLCDVLEP